MKLTAEELAARRKGIGASEIGAIAGLNRFSTPFDVWAVKVGERDAFEGNDATEWGNRLEDAIAQKYADDTGATIAKGATVRHSEHAWMFATPDRIVRHPTDGEGLLEIKTASWRTADEWGEPGTDEVPPSYLAQAQWQLAVWHTVAWCDFAVLIDGREYRTYRVRRDDSLIAQLIKIASGFWHEHVLPRVPPQFDGSEGAQEYVLKRFPKNTSKELRPADPSAQQLIDQLLAARSAKKQAIKAEDALKQALGMIIGDAAGLTLPDGRGKITWTKNKDSTQIDAKELIALLKPHVREDVWEECTSLATKTKPGARVFRVAVKGDDDE